MGWANCGEDSEGRPIGYAHEATCDHEGCSKKIDRGLSYACGDMHGASEYGCEKYFCEEHRSNWVKTGSSSKPEVVNVCDECAEDLLDSGEWFDNEDEACIERLEL